MQLKEQHFYCCSTFHSHSRVFNNEHDLYAIISVKQNLDCSLASTLFVFSLIKFQFLKFASGKFYFMLCYFMLSYHVSLSHLNTSRFPIWKTCNNHTRSKFPNFFALFAHVVVNPTIIWSRSQQPYTIYKYPGIWLVDSRCIFTFRIKFVEFLILPGYFHKDFTFSPLCCGIFQNVFV
jgi:hypothetical protein